MGAVWGDIDNDGREDLLVYRYGYLSLFKNVDGHHFVGHHRSRPASIAG